MQPHVQIDQLSFHYKDRGFEIHDLSLHVPKGAILSLVGPSGCGKSTLLQLLAGFLYPISGRILVDGRDISRLPPEKRELAMVFQNYALFPHLNILDNLAFGLKIRGLGRTAQQEKAMAMLQRIGLDVSFSKKKPFELSGGQQQRVALGRALILEPKVLFLDEPLANLDRRLRETMRGEITRLCHEHHVTTILVTHDQEEALSMGDLVAVMKNGAIEQLDRPEICYRKPRTAFVSEFLGDINFFNIRQLDGTLLWQEIPYAIPGTMQITPKIAAIRPEFIRLAPREEGGIQARVIGTTFLGSAFDITALVNEKKIKIRCSQRPSGEHVALHFDIHSWLFFP